MSLGMFDLKSEADYAGMAASDVPDMASSGVNEAQDFPRVELWKPPGPIADAFFWSDADVIGIRGPVGSGKTTAHLRSRIRRARMMPRSVIDGWRRYKVTIARQTYRQLWSTTIPSWWAVMPKSQGKWAGGRGDPVTHVIQFEDAHGPIEFIAEFMAFGETPGEIDANIRGVQTTDLAFEEADTVSVAAFTKGITRIRRYPGIDHFRHLPRELQGYGQVSCSYNSPDEDNWTVRVIEGHNLDPEAQRVRDSLSDTGVDITFFRQPGFDEPGCENLQNLDPKYYTTAIAAMRAEGRGNDVDRLIYNKIGYIRVGDPVFRTHYKPNIHRARSPLEAIPGVPLRIGLDQGYFGAAVIGQFVAPFQWRILAELVFKEGSFAPEFGAALRELLDTRFPGHPVYSPAFCDMAGSANESLEDVTWMNTVAEAAKLEIEPQRLGGNRIEPRLAVWRAAMDWQHFGDPGLLIDPSCKWLLRGLENDYVWAQDAEKAENRKRIPKKRGVRSADVIDAGGYMMLGESLADGRPKTSDLIGHNGGPSLDDEGGYASGVSTSDYSFDPLEGI